MKIIKTHIEDLFVIEPRVFNDDRGYFFESYNKKVFEDNLILNTFVQDNQSKSSYGVIRGLHAQSGAHAQAKLVRVLEGKVLDVAVDIRENSPTYGQHFSIELSAENQKQLLIPRGFLHGFSVLSESAIFFYKCDNSYCKEAEIGVRFDDENLAIDWQIPPDKASVSEKDLILGSLKEITPHKV